ncbi:MAG TPA: hypothetical protein VF459_20195 [Caulobacteraceae bacterium]
MPRAPFLPLFALLLAFAAAGCSRHDQASVQHDARAAVADVKAEAHKVANDPDMRKAGAEVKKTAAEAAAAIKHTAQQARDAAEHGAHETRRKSDDS